MGLVHIYCGDGKGKTTAALGLALRAAGSGMSVHIVQFLKSEKTSELETLKCIPKISVDRCSENFGFTFQMNEEEKKRQEKCHNEMLERAKKMLEEGLVDMLILDEFNAAYAHDLLDKQLADTIVFSKPEKVELVLTGRDPKPKFVERADYVSEIKAVKHPFSNGIKARKGIEF